MDKDVITKEIAPRILTVRGVQVMLDRDLADLFETETKYVNRAVSRNKDRFPLDFVFQLTAEEWSDLRFQIGTLNYERGGRRYRPFAFTEQGIAMLATSLNSSRAVLASISIMRAFVYMRRVISSTHGLMGKISELESRQIRTEMRIDEIFDSLYNIQDIKHGIFFNDQIFDAYTFMSDVIRKAKKSVILIDNYIDDTTLLQLGKRNAGVEAIIYTERISEQLKLDLNKHHKQYPTIEVCTLKHVHDRFLIIDEKELFHIGASLKDLGKKWFAFSRIDSIIPEILKRLA